MNGTTKTSAEVVELTDTYGNVVTDIDQPNPGSVIMIGGFHGVAWQRHFSDGRWYSTTGARRTFSSIMRQRNVLLVYAASVREED